MNIPDMENILNSLEDASVPQSYSRALVNIGSEVGASKIALISSSQATIER